MKASSTVPLHEQYKLFREYVEHEDTLIDNRLSWSINIQGFLFLTYGYSVHKLAELHKESMDAKLGPLYILIVVLPIMGAVIGAFSVAGVRAAANAIGRLKIRWDGIVAEHPEKLFLQELTGGGDEKAHGMGLRAPRWFPWIFVIAWALLLLLNIILGGHHLYVCHVAGGLQC